MGCGEWRTFADEKSTSRSICTPSGLSGAGINFSSEPVERSRVSDPGATAFGCGGCGVDGPAPPSAALASPAGGAAAAAASSSSSVMKSMLSWRAHTHLRDAIVPSAARTITGRSRSTGTSSKAAARFT